VAREPSMEHMGHRQASMFVQSTTVFPTVFAGVFVESDLVGPRLVTFAKKHSFKVKANSVFLDGRKMASEKTLHHMLDAEATVAQFGDLQMSLSSSRHKMSVAKYMGRDGDLGFAQLFHSSNGLAPLYDSVLAELDHGRGLPPALRPMDGRLILSLGRNFTGSMLHRHNASWLFVASGAINWHILPPDVPVSHSMLTHNPCVLQNDFPEFPWMECRQEAGAVVYLPAHYWHATCNSEGPLTISAGAQNDSLSSLSRAARNGDAAAVRQIWPNSGSTVDGGEGRIALSWAVSHDKALTVSALVDLDPSLLMQPRGPQGLLPAHEAAQHGSAEAMRALLSKDQGQATVLDSSLNQPAHAAAHDNQADVLKLLHAWGADIDAPDRAEWTPLHQAAQAGHASMIDVLMGLGANVSSLSIVGQTAIEMASERGHNAAVEALLRHGGEAIEAQALLNSREL